MAKNITYLLGAGASFNALPLVEDIPRRLEGFSYAFHINNFDHTIKHQQKSNIAEQHLFRFKTIDEQKIEFEKIKNFHRDILWLKDESRNHTSIDTFAKKLYLQENTSDLKKLKYILSCFFIYEQTYYFDNRYDSFFASILESLTEIPNNLKVLSWNCDSQLEIAFSRFSNTTIKESREILNIFSKGNKVDSSKTNLVDELNIFKINGTTSILDKESKNYNLILDYNIDKVKLVSSFLEIYGSRTLFSTHEPNMSFAWENFYEELKFYSNLRDSIVNTDILIVIGYSFPFFNRKIDKFILDSMDNLKKIYVQDPYNAEEVIEKIKELKPWQEQASSFNGSSLETTTVNKIQFKPIKFDKQFFIPIEF
ncbi:hypothetical protein [Hyunsoonleella pacifica]|uniref:SIR2-like domain-containing protein n=1 Tax=Hyunsoonleella pacifica TaxID=1080224 RepID=A0A4Q9FPW2_9FLAO|nr:hypothetical protein [Hyunsoonleella pacifica]TBN14699.1 hypothetical protein EYD46_14120 [Hyunsoonleella pacifica]GGD15961.1 hypothetical protein GCM10011368_17400 [Hyunsoonleella pacifica]